MVNIPEGVTVSVDGNTVTAKGSAGELVKSFSKHVSIKLEGSNLEVESKSLAMENTVSALLENMLEGVKSGFKKNAKLLYAHFPISIEIKGKDILVKNFLGEKQPRKTRLVDNTKVEVKGQNVTISGPDKEAVGQTFANLRQIMRIKEKDGRIFQDGIFEIQG